MRPAAVVGEPAVAERLTEAGVPAVAVGAGPAAALGRTAREAPVTVVTTPAAARAAEWSRRLTRTPWVVYVSPDIQEQLRDPAVVSSLERAAAVLVDDEGADVVAGAAPRARLVSVRQPDRVRAALADIGLAPTGRRHGGAALPTLAGDAWTFLNDRATRVAIRGMRWTRRSPVPIHPRHLVPAPWDTWYVRHLRGSDRLLDVGCSNGAHTLQAARVVASAVGVDVDGEELERAVARADQEGVRDVIFRRLDLSDSDALARELGDRRFDAILLLDVLEHIVERVGLLAQLRDRLDDGGRLFVAVPNGYTPYRRALRRLGAFAYMDPDHKTEYSDALLETELREAGLAIAHRERGGYDSPFTGMSTLAAVLSLRLYARMAIRRHRRAEERPDRASALRVVAVRSTH